MYDNGEGIPENDEKAVNWYLKAAEQGFAKAQYNLAISYDNGEGVSENNEEAVRWYRKAAVQDHAKAQTNLGTMYEYGLGVSENNIIAHMWYNIGNANGNAQGGKNRNDIADEMTTADISIAQDIAKECMNSDYTNCS